MYNGVKRGIPCMDTPSTYYCSMIFSQHLFMSSDFCFHGFCTSQDMMGSQRKSTKLNNCISKTFPPLHIQIDRTQSLNFFVTRERSIHLSYFVQVQKTHLCNKQRNKDLNV